MIAQIRPRAAVLLLLPLLLAAGCSSGSDEPSSGPSHTTGKCRYTQDGSKAAKPVALPPGNPETSPPTTAVLTTNVGNLAITLDPDRAPCTVGSFLSLAEQGFYTNTPCHRLTTEGYYVLQCGDPMGTGQGGPGYTFPDELVPNDPRLQPCGSVEGQAYCTYPTGAVAMANRGPDSNGSQFFLVYGSSRFPPDFTVFGHLDDAGQKIVQKVAAQGVGTSSGMGPGDGVPKERVTITGIETR